MSVVIPPSPTNPNALPAPRNEAARRRSRLNARVHGLTAHLPDTEEEEAAMKAFADHWTKELGPDTAAQEALIRASASAFARVERARKIEESTMKQSAVDAVARWEKKKRHRIRAKAQELAHDPVNTVADLECSSFGCEWMMRHWLALKATLDQGIAWKDTDVEQAMRLFGLLPQAPGPDADPFAGRLWGLARMAAGHPPLPDLGLPTDILPARSELRRLIDAEFSRLDRIRQELWDSLDGPEAEAVARRGLEDTTEDGQLRKRYAKEAFSQMTRALALVMKIRVENGKFADRLWWQAHPHVKKARGVTPFTHPEASPPCLIPDPRPTPAPSAPVEPPSPRNEPPSEPATAPRLQPNSPSSNEMRNGAPPRSPASFERSLPTSTPQPAPSGPTVSSVPRPFEPSAWPADSPLRA